MGPEVDAASFRARGKEGVVVQTVSDSVPKNEHLYELLAAQTLTAAKSRELLGRKPEVDLLLRVAGTTQISEALARVGVRPGSPFVLVVCGTRALPKKLLDRCEKEGERLPRRTLTARDLSMVEDAALLSAEKG